MRQFAPLVLCTLLAAAAPAAAQLSFGGTPPSLEHALRTDTVPTVAFPGVDVGQLFTEDAAAPKGTPFRFGVELPLGLGLSDGVWDALPDGGATWRLRLSSQGAHSLAVLFSEFELADRTRLYVHNDDYGTILGAYDWRNNKEDGEFAFEPVKGSAITLELHVEAGAAPSRLRLARLVHDYRDVFALLKQSDGDAAGACNVDVNCPQGAPWALQKRAVTMLIIGGSLCSGSLLNNTLNDGTQYFMSANHCGSLNNAVFRFKYEKAGCGSGSAPTNNTVQGSVQLAASSTYDYRLVRITSPIPSSFNPYFLGWNRSTSPGAGTVTIHHPAGDVKKISFDNQAPSLSGSQWRIVQWDLGVTEGGSSGCPLMDNQGRFIGQLCCGAAYCGYPYDDYYGRFDQAWNAVKTWLDPNNSNVTAIAGFDPQGGTPSPPVLNTVSPASVQAFAGGTVTLSGSKFTGASSVTVGTQVLSAGAFTVNSDTTITFQLVGAPSLGAKNVTVTTSAGTSAAKVLTVLETAPPKISASPNTGAGQLFVWSYGGGASDNFWLLIATNASTFNYGGYPILTNGQIVLSGALSASGLGAAQATIPAGLAGLFFWSQVVTFNNVGGAFVGASGVTGTVIGF